MKPKAIDIYGNDLSNGILYHGHHLNSVHVRCYNKNLTELIIPDGITSIYCQINKLTELIIPDGVKDVWCYDNNITEIVLPDSIISIVCDVNTKLRISKKFKGEITKIL